MKGKKKIMNKGMCKQQKNVSEMILRIFKRPFNRHESELSSHVIACQLLYIFKLINQCISRLVEKE